MKYDYNIVVIGAGSAGLVSAYIAAALNAKVALIEKNKMGGDCLNTGCVPSKALIRTAHFLNDVHHHEKLGIRHAEADFDFSTVMERIQRVIKKVEPHDSLERYKALGVDVVSGCAEIQSPHEVQVEGRTLTAKSIILATGAAPMVPELPGMEDVEILNTENIWDLRERPDNLLVLGGGPVGSEMSQAFHRLGIPVTQIEKHDQILTKEDPDIAELVLDRFREEGIKTHLNRAAASFSVTDGRKALVVESPEGNSEEIEFDQILVALGRRPNTKGVGLENIGVELDDRGRIAIDDYGRTNVPNVFACGDCASPYQFTHMAAHGAYYCVVNALFGFIPFVKQKINYNAVPWCTYTDPEVARVGLSETDAKREGTPYELTTYNLEELDRAITDDEDYGVVKLLTVPGKDTILGVTICACRAGDILPEYVLAKNYNLGLSKIMGTIHVYPTVGEANKYAAGNWKKAHKPETILRFLKKFHAWRR